MNNPIDWLLGLFSLDIGIDLGTANTLVHVKNRGIVINEPSVVAIDISSRRRNKVKAIGSEAKEMVGRTPSHIVAIRPLQVGIDRYRSRTSEEARTVLFLPGIPAGELALNFGENPVVYDRATSPGACHILLL